MNEISFSPVVILVTGFPPFPVEALSVRAELPVLFSSLKMFSSKPQIFLFFFFGCAYLVSFPPFSN